MTLQAGLLGFTAFMQPPPYQSAVCQKLQADFQAKIDSFREFVEKQVTEHNVSLDHIIDMDEVCFWSWIL